MDYNFLADFLTKFSSFSDPIKGLIVLTIGVIIISFLYFMQSTVTEIIRLIIKPFLVSNLWKSSLKELSLCEKLTDNN